MIAEPQTRVHELTTADLAGQVDAQKQPDGPTLVRGPREEIELYTQAMQKRIAELDALSVGVGLTGS